MTRLAHDPEYRTQQRANLPLPLFDPAPAVSNWRRRADAAMSSVYRNADEAWQHAALAELVELADERSTFITYDLFKRLQNLRPDVSTHDLRAIGPVVKTAARLGLIRHNGNYAKNPNRNGSPCPVWEKAL